MTHGLLTICSTAAALAAAVPLASAEPSVTPIDRQRSGTLEVSSEYGFHSETIAGQDESTLAQPREGSIAVGARMWLADWLSVEARQPMAIHSSGNTDGASADSDGRGVKDLSIGGSAFSDYGPWTIASSMALVLPTGTRPVSDNQLSARVSVSAGKPLGERSIGYLTPSYLVKRGDSRTDAVHELGLNAGVLQRFGSWFVLPTVGIERTSALASDSGQDSFWTWSASMGAGVTVNRRLELHARAGLDLASDHTMASGTRANSRQSLIQLGLQYQWDLPRTTSRARRVPDPVALQVVPVLMDGQKPNSQAEGLATHLIPSLRLATVAAERAAGGASGEMTVTVERALEGGPPTVSVRDEVGDPGLAHVVARFFRDVHLPEGLARAQQIELKVCFATCHN